MVLVCVSMVPVAPVLIVIGRVAASVMLLAPACRVPLPTKFTVPPLAQGRIGRDVQQAIADVRAARVGIAAGEGQRAAAAECQAAGAAGDRAAKGERAGAQLVDDECRTVAPT